MLLSFIVRQNNNYSTSRVCCAIKNMTPEELVSSTQIAKTD